MITLPHTAMQIPTDRIRITSITHLGIGPGIAWSAELRNGATTLGTITNDGHGSATFFHPATPTARRVLDDFVAQCRTPEGEPLTEETVLDSLVGEYRSATYVARAERRGAFQVRFRTAYPDTWAVFWLRVPNTRPPDYEAAVNAARRAKLPSIAVSAELWMGAKRGWVEVYRAPDQP